MCVQGKQIAAAIIWFAADYLDVYFLRKHTLSRGLRGQ